MSDLNCPYCQIPFSTFPAKKTNCPACGGQVHPKRRHTDVVGVKVLLTSIQADEAEQAWLVDTKKSQYVQFLAGIEMTFEQLTKLVPKESTPDDIVYAGLQVTLSNSAIDDLNHRMIAYHMLGNIAWRKGFHDQALEFHRKGYLNKAKNLSTKLPVVAGLHLELHAGPRACANCKRATGIFDIGDFISEQPIPHASCTELPKTSGQGCLMVMPYISK